MYIVTKYLLIQYHVKHFEISVLIWSLLLVYLCSLTNVGWKVPSFVQFNVMLFAITNGVDLLD